MNTYTILMSNLGYARGIGGSLAGHIRHAHRHFYCPPQVQEESLRQLNELIAREEPDICCFVEIDKGSFTSGGFNQLQRLVNERYPFFDIENKYPPHSRLRSFFITKGKSNAFVSKQDLGFERIYFTHGIKRLIYQIQLHQNLTLFFAHFSLNKSVRKKQILEAGHLINRTKGEVIFMGDFNILTGMQEIAPLSSHDRLVLLNREDSPTFVFHKYQMILDLCFCSKTIARNAELKIIPQPWSDHAALVLKINF